MKLPAQLKEIAAKVLSAPRAATAADLAAVAAFVKAAPPLSVRPMPADVFTATEVFGFRRTLSQPEPTAGDVLALVEGLRRLSQFAPAAPSPAATANGDGGGDGSDDSGTPRAWILDRKVRELVEVEQRLRQDDKPAAADRTRVAREAAERELHDLLPE